MATKRVPYQEVRALDRGLRILEILGQHGWTTPRILSQMTKIDRSSTYRLLNTLVETGYAVKRADDGSFALTSKVSTIGDGFTQNELASQIVAPHLQNLTRQINWPSDYAVLVGGEVTIVESTHRISPMTTYRSMIGKKRPLMMSALGRAILSAMNEDELDVTLHVLSELGGGTSSVSRLRNTADKLIREVREDGYASAAGTSDVKISSIALPVRTPNSIIGAVNIIFFRSALTISQAADRYLAPLKACADQIMRELSVKIDKEKASNRLPAGGRDVITSPKRVRDSSSRNNRSS